MSFPWEKGPIEPLLNSDSSFSEKNLNTSSNISTNKALAETTASTKKNLSYIFKLDVTKRKLETIAKKIDQLTNKSAVLENAIQALYRKFTSFLDQSYKIDLEYKELFEAFRQNLTSYSIDDIQIVLNLQKREAFLKKLPEDQQPMAQQFLNELCVFYLKVQIKKGVLDEKNKEIAGLQKQIDELQKQFAANQDLLAETQKKYDDVDEHGLLKSYESSDSKVFCQDMVASPVLEDQFNKLINMYNNRDEARKFWLPLPKGVLFVGDPETGKTFAARVLASEIGRTMYHIKAHDIFAEDEQNPNELLYVIFDAIINHTKKTWEPCIIFLDEIEKIISSMGERSSTDKIIISNTIIKNIINIQKSDLDIIILAALSQKNKLDERFLKYHIFDNQFFFELPKENERKRLFQLYIKKAETRAKLKLFDPDMLDELVKKTDGRSAEHIKQLVSSSVKEYFYNYMQKKETFAIDEKFIWTALEQIGSQKNSKLSPAKRKKILDVLITQYTMKHNIFWILDAKKRAALLQYMLDYTEGFTESELNQLIQLCVDEYQKRKFNYHKQSLIQKDFVLAKIQQMNDEEKVKWNRSYYNYR